MSEQIGVKVTIDIIYGEEVVLGKRILTRIQEAVEDVLPFKTASLKLQMTSLYAAEPNLAEANLEAASLPSGDGEKGDEPSPPTSSGLNGGGSVEED